MKQELQQKLYDKYPELFVNRTLPASKSLMCFGLEVGDGWYTIVDAVCWSLVAEMRYLESRQLPMSESMLLTPEDERADWTPFMREAYTPEKVEALRRQLEEMKERIPRFTQVKEKFGGLRMYYTGGTDTQRALISMACALSYKTCEDCGATGVSAEVRNWPFSWMRTLCRACAVAWKGEEAVIAVEQNRELEEEED